MRLERMTRNQLLRTSLGWSPACLEPLRSCYRPGGSSQIPQVKHQWQLLTSSEVLWRMPAVPETPGVHGLRETDGSGSFLEEYGEVSTRTLRGARCLILSKCRLVKLERRCVFLWCDTRRELVSEKYLLEQVVGVSGTGGYYLWYPQKGKGKVKTFLHENWMQNN